MEDPQLGVPMGEAMVDLQLEEDGVEMLPILGGLLWTDGIRAGQIVPLVIMTVEIHPEGIMETLHHKDRDLTVAHPEVHPGQLKIHLEVKELPDEITNELLVDNLIQHLCMMNK